VDLVTIGDLASETGAIRTFSSFESERQIPYLLGKTEPDGQNEFHSRIVGIWSSAYIDGSGRSTGEAIQACGARLPIDGGRVFNSLPLNSS
jgi:hypothetical protein